MSTTLRVVAFAVAGGLAGLLGARQACALHATEEPAAAATAPAPPAADVLPPARPMHADWVTPPLAGPGAAGAGEPANVPPRDPRLGEPQAPAREPRPEDWLLTAAPPQPAAL